MRKIILTALLLIAVGLLPSLISQPDSKSYAHYATQHERIQAMMRQSPNSRFLRWWLHLTDAERAAQLRMQGRMREAFEVLAGGSGATCSATWVPLALTANWTLIDCQAVSAQNAHQSGLTGYGTMGFFNNSAVHTGDTIVGFFDQDSQATSWTEGPCTDNASNTFTKLPQTDFNLVNGPANVAGNDFYVLGSASALGSGYLMTCDASLSGGNAAMDDVDISVFLLRQTSGNASAGLDSSVPWQNNTSAGGTCPCSQGSLTDTVVTAGSIIIGIAQENGTTGPGMFSAGTTYGCDGDGMTTGFPFWFTACSTVTASGNITWNPEDSAPNDNGAQGLFALKPASSGGTASFSPSSLGFAAQQVGLGSTHQSFTLTNTAGSSMTITSIALSGAGASDYSQTNNCPATLGASSSCTITVFFSATASGNRPVNVVFTDSATGSPQSVPVLGTGYNGSIAVF